jgi:CHAD domain-containing protein
MASLPQDLALAVRRVTRSPGPVNVHDLRVAIRRFNQASASSFAAGSSNRNKTRHRETKEIMRRAGDVRNLDITIKLVAKLKGTKGLQTKLRRRRQAAARHLTDPLKAWSPPEKLPEPTPAQAKRAAVRAIKRLFKRSAEAHRPKDLHRVRIAAKKLRYTLEMVAPQHAEMEQIKRLQTDLGRINDYETAWTLVKQESGAQSVRDELKDKQRKKIRAFRDQWSGILTDPAVARTWIRNLS